MMLPWLPFGPDFFGFADWDDGADVSAFFFGGAGVSSSENDSQPGS